MVEVVAGIIEKEGRILICQRRPDQAHPRKWEFPGGKIESGETPAEALQRELWEELGVETVVGEELLRYEFSYPTKTPILLIFLKVAECTGNIDNRIFAQVEWCAISALREYDFLEGDADFIAWFAA